MPDEILVTLGAQNALYLLASLFVTPQTIVAMEDPGYPIVEVTKDGSFVVTKHDGTGGRVSVAGVTEQLLYEMGDPTNYITPDCVVDFTSIRLKQVGTDQVQVSGVAGRPATDSRRFRP